MAESHGTRIDYTDMNHHTVTNHCPEMHNHVGATDSIIGKPSTRNGSGCKDDLIHMREPSHKSVVSTIMITNGEIYKVNRVSSSLMLIARLSNTKQRAPINTPTYTIL